MNPKAGILYTFLALVIIALMVYIAFLREPQETILQPTPVPAIAQVWSPGLIAPPDGFSTYPADVTLEWSWREPLQEDQLFTVRFWREGDSPADIAWTDSTKLNISSFLDSGIPGRYYWQVAVIQLNPDGSFAGMASGWSPVWQIERIPPTPLPTRTPIPTRIPPTSTISPRFLEPNPYNSPENDIDSLIDIHSPADADQKRELLINLLWGDPGFPRDKLPAQVETNVQDPNYAGLVNLKSIDRLTISMDLGIESYPYIFHPVNSNNQLIIYHQGSDGDFLLGIETIQFFLQEGYTVMAFAMPLLGNNNHPEVFIPHLGNVRLPGALHFQLFFVEDLIEQGIILKVFIEPVIVGLNYADTLGFERYAMIGISGGGWTTHLVAAVDRRIERSYPVAGSIPFFQRFDGQAADTDLLAYVQMLPGIFPDLNYLELYILGAYGVNRKQLMVINQFDPCCFWGVRYRVWYDTVQARMTQLGMGTFEVFLDDTHKQHIISPAALQMVLADLQPDALSLGR
jgi:hypothetical protein